MPVAAIDLTTVANVKIWLGITAGVTTMDALLQQLITAISTYCQNTYINRTIASTAYTKALDGTGTQRQPLKHFPVSAVASVLVDSVAVPLSTGISYGYLFDEYGLYFIGGEFTVGMQNVIVTYTAGYAVTPADLEQSIIEMVGHTFKKKDRIGEISKNIDRIQVNFFAGDVPPDIKAVWERYKRVVPV